MLFQPMMLLPAYGKTYTTSAEIETAWKAGKDFKMNGSGGYCSIRDMNTLMEGTSSLTIVSPLPCNARYLIATM